MRLRAEVDRLYDFNESGLTCSKHWAHPSKCCNGKYTAIFVNTKSIRLNNKELEFLRSRNRALEKKLKSAKEILSEEEYIYK